MSDRFVFLVFYVISTSLTVEPWLFVPDYMYVYRIFLS